MSIVVFILILSGLVIIHEFGHFIVSKLNGITVEEFGLGYPPKIFGKKFGDTLYSINLLPFGGFVKIAGSDIEDEEDEAMYLHDSKSFVNKTAWQKAKVIGAGAFMNLILAVVLFYIFLGFNNFRSFNIPMFFDHDFKLGLPNYIDTVVFDMSEDSGALKAGIEAGEAIVEIDGRQVLNIDDVRNAVSGKIGQEVELKLLDIKDRSYDKLRMVKVIPTVGDDGDAVLGVYLGSSVSISYNSSPGQRVLSGPMHAYNMLSYSLSTLSKIIGVSVETRDISPVSQSVAGPIGIYNVFDSVVKYGGSKVVLGLIDTVALVSLGFAITNILPFPALDGGRLVFIAIEGLTKRKVSSRIEANIHKVGMMLLLALVVLITVKDIFR
ncbi:MAG: M50 family metallopeptidase [Patescibacteria group bacterium]